MLNQYSRTSDKICIECHWEKNEFCCRPLNKKDVVTGESLLVDRLCVYERNGGSRLTDWLCDPFSCGSIGRFWKARARNSGAVVL